MVEKFPERRLKAAELAFLYNSKTNFFIIVKEIIYRNLRIF